MAESRKSSIGVGVLLLLIGIANVGPWQTATPHGTVAKVAHYVVVAILFVSGIWFLFSKTIVKIVEIRPY